MYQQIIDGKDVACQRWRRYLEQQINQLHLQCVEAKVLVAGPASVGDSMLTCIQITVCVRCAARLEIATSVAPLACCHWLQYRTLLRSISTAHLRCVGQILVLLPLNQLGRLVRDRACEVRVAVPQRQRADACGGNCVVTNLLQRTSGCDRHICCRNINVITTIASSMNVYHTGK